MAIRILKLGMHGVATDILVFFIQLLEYVIPTTATAAPPKSPLRYGVSLCYSVSPCYGVSPALLLCTVVLWC